VNFFHFEEYLAGFNCLRGLRMIASFNSCINHCKSFEKLPKLNGLVNFKPTERIPLCATTSRILSESSRAEEN
jgi:hypothetical protein